MKVISIVVNSTDFIELQYHSFKKYLKGGEYEFIIFNDAKDFPDYTNGGDITIRKRIEETCSQLQIRCINIPNSHHSSVQNASNRHVDSLNFMLEYQKQKPDKYLIIDSDIFIIDTFDITKYFQYEAVAVLQTKFVNGCNIYYPWPGFFYIDMTKTKNIELMDYSLCPGGDTGALMYKWFMNIIGNNPILNNDKGTVINNVYFPKNMTAGQWELKDMPENLKTNTSLNKILNIDIRRENNHIFSEIYDNAFFHYRSGCNWRGEGIALHMKMTQIMKTLFM